MDFLSHLEVDILSNLGQFLEFGVDPRLCVGLRELSCAPSRKLVDIEPSGVLFGAISSLGSSVVTQKRVFARGVFVTKRSSGTVFRHHILSVAIENALIQCRRRGSSPRAPKSAEN